MRGTPPVWRATSAKACWSRPCKITRKPLRANAAAAADPIPDDPPVTSATGPVIGAR